MLAKQAKNETNLQKRGLMVEELNIVTKHVIFRIIKSL
jgi:hypothetical protein